MFTFALSYIAASVQDETQEGSRCRNPCTGPQHITHRAPHSHRVRTTHSHSCLPAPLEAFEDRDPTTSHPPIYPHPHFVTSFGSQLKHHLLREAFLKGSDQPDPHHTFSQHLCISIDFFNFNELLNFTHWLFVQWLSSLPGHKLYERKCCRLNVCVPLKLHLLKS